MSELVPEWDTLLIGVLSLLLAYVIGARLRLRRRETTETAGVGIETMD